MTALHPPTYMKISAPVAIPSQSTADRREDTNGGTYLLHELTASAKKHSTEMLGFAIREQSLIWRALASKHAGSFDRIKNDTALGSSLLAVHFISSNGGNDVSGIFISLVGEQPSRAFRQPDHGGGDGDAEDNLEGDWETPDKVCRAVRCAIVYPVGDESAECNGAALDTDEETPIRGFTAFSWIHVSGLSQHTPTECVCVP